MNISAPVAATLLQALMGPDAAAPADPAAPVAGGDFAMMMAGVATSPVTPADDAAAGDDVTKAAARDQDESDSSADEAPDAALLAMLAITPPPAPADVPVSGGKTVQAPATISAAALTAGRDAAVPPGAGRLDPQARSPDKDIAAPTAAEAAVPAQAAPVQPDAGDPVAPAAAPPADAVASQRPSGATTAVRKAIAGILGLKSSTPAPGLARPGTAGPAPLAADEAADRHADDAADTAAAAADDKHADADAPAIAVAAADGSTAVIAPAGTVALQGDASSHAVRHPAADVSAQLGEHHIALAQGDGWLDQLARDISSTAAPDGKLHFRLAPERLGSLQVEVTRGADGAAVRLTTESRATRDILVDAQPQLAAQAQAQGVRIAGTHVDLGAGTSGGQAGGRQEHAPMPQVRALGTAGVTPATETTGTRSAASERYA